MKIKILHLFADYLNLYGDSANIKAIEKYLNAQKIDYELIRHCYNEEIDLNDTDLIFIGCGTENNLASAYHKLLNYKDDLKSYIALNKAILLTGNAATLFSNQRLKLFDYDIENFNRYAYEAILSANFTKELMIGFFNGEYRIKDNKQYLFKLEIQNQNKLNFEYDGYQYQNFYASSFIGPILVRNYQFLDHLMKKIILNKDPNFPIKELDFKLEKKALGQYLKDYYKINQA